MHIFATVTSEENYTQAILFLKTVVDVRHNFDFENNPSCRGAAFYNCLPEDSKILQVRNLRKSLTDLNRSIYTTKRVLKFTQHCS